MTLPAWLLCAVMVRPRATASSMHSRAMAVRVRFEASAKRHSSASVATLIVVLMRVLPLPAVWSDLRLVVRFIGEISHR